MPTRNVNLTDHFDKLIETGVASGRYGNASEMVREGLRLLEQREEEDRAKLEWLRSAVQEGVDDIERGNYTELRSREDIERFMNQVHEEASGEPAVRRGRG